MLEEDPEDSQDRVVGISKITSETVYEVDPGRYYRAKICQVWKYVSEWM